MSAHVKRVGGDKMRGLQMRGLPTILSLFVTALINSMIQEHEYHILFIT